MMKDLGALMKQAQEMKKNMTEMQDKMTSTEVVGSAGGDLVTLTFSGDKKLQKVKLDPSVVDPEDTEMLEDLLVAAAADAHKKLEELMQSEMSSLTGGLPLPPGLKLPF